MIAGIEFKSFREVASNILQTLSRFLQVPQKRATNIALPRCLNVQSHNAVEVDMITKLADELQQLDILGIGFCIDHIGKSGLIAVVLLSTFKKDRSIAVKRRGIRFGER
ncbi:MAG TPA: hypothetical protein VIU63_06875 [Nitrospira sp.]